MVGVLVGTGVLVAGLGVDVAIRGVFVGGTYGVGDFVLVGVRLGVTGVGVGVRVGVRVGVGVLMETIVSFAGMR